MKTVNLTKKLGQTHRVRSWTRFSRPLEEGPPFQQQQAATSGLLLQEGRLH